jgi:three-Cys-motif partner protein
MEGEIVDDGLDTPEVGYWGRRKYHFLSRYLALFSTGMKNKWPVRHFIDLFAGSGRALLKGSREVVLTSSTLAATVDSPFTRIHSCDADASKCKALNARLTALRDPSTFAVHHGDANRVVGAIVNSVPSSALCVTFADPYGLHLDFETVQRIASIRSDLIILLADNMDALRDWASIYLQNPKSSLDRFMGEPGWRDMFASTPSDKQAEAFRKRYQERLETLGYQHFAHERFQNSQGRDIYSLLYATRHPRGLDFWKKAADIDEGGQRKLPFA